MDAAAHDKKSESFPENEAMNVQIVSSSDNSNATCTGNTAEEERNKEKDNSSEEKLPAEETLHEGAPVEDSRTENPTDGHLPNEPPPNDESKLAELSKEENAKEEARTEVSPKETPESKPLKESVAEEALGERLPTQSNNSDKPVKCMDPLSREEIKQLLTEKVKEALAQGLKADVESKKRALVESLRTGIEEKKRVQLELLQNEMEEKRKSMEEAMLNELRDKHSSLQEMIKEMVAEVLTQRVQDKEALLTDKFKQELQDRQKLMRDMFRKEMSNQQQTVINVLNQEIKDRKQLEYEVRNEMRRIKGVMDGHIYQQCNELCERMKHAQKDVKEELSEKVEQVTATLMKLEHQLREIAETLPEFPLETTCVIANLPEEVNENLYSKCCDLLNKYWLNVTDLPHPKRCERIKSRDRRPGLVQMQMRTKKEKEMVLNNKSTLKNFDRPYNNIFIRSSTANTERINRANLECLLREIPSGEQFKINKVGKIVKKKAEERRRVRRRDNALVSRGLIDVSAGTHYRNITRLMQQQQQQQQNSQADNQTGQSTSAHQTSSHHAHQTADAVQQAPVSSTSNRQASAPSTTCTQQVSSIRISEPATEAERVVQAPVVTVSGPVRSTLKSTAPIFVPRSKCNATSQARTSPRACTISTQTSVPTQRGPGTQHGPGTQNGQHVPIQHDRQALVTQNGQQAPRAHHSQHGPTQQGPGTHHGQHVPTQHDRQAFRTQHGQQAPTQHSQYTAQNMQPPSISTVAESVYAPDNYLTVANSSLDSSYGGPNVQPQEWTMDHAIRASRNPQTG